MAFNGIDAVLRPKVEVSGAYAGKVKVVLRLQVQPWHSSSTLTHEAALAVSTLDLDHTYHTRAPVLLLEACFADNNIALHDQTVYRSSERPQRTSGNTVSL